jgi:cytidylate kinase
MAPLENRIEHIMQVRNATRQEAEKYVLKTDNDRQAFIRKYFHMDITDASQYDLVINMRINTVEGAVEAIKAAFLKRKTIAADSLSSVG